MWLSRVTAFKPAIGFGPAQVLRGYLCLIFQWRGKHHDEDVTIELNSPVLQSSSPSNTVRLFSAELYTKHS